jgi:ATP-dependent Lon protease
VLIPQRNEPDLDDVPAEVLAKLSVHPMSDVRDVLALALEPASSAAVSADGADSAAVTAAA